MIVYSVLSIFEGKIGAIDLNVFLVNLILAVVIFLVGFGLGWIVKVILKKLIENSEIEKTTSKSFINLFLTIIKWSIYLLFVSLALKQLGIPELTSWLTSILVVIPAFVGALILIAVGFAIAVYLKDLVEESKILGWQVLSMILFYFVLYVALVFALRTALLSQDKTTVNIIMIIFTAAAAFGVAFWHLKNKK